jgi:hypothetical protein
MMKVDMSRRRTSTIFVALFYLLIAQTLMSDTVLCFGADGHVAVETISARCCGYPSSTTFPEILHITSLLDGHCAPCTDIPLVTGRSGQYLVPAQGTAPQVNASVLPAFWSSILAHEEIVTNDLFPRRFPATNPTFTSLRTVILLI